MHPAPPFAPRGPSGWFPHFIARTAALRLLVTPLALAVLARAARLPAGRCRGLPGSWATLADVPRSKTPVEVVRRWDPGLRPVFSRTTVAFRCADCVGLHDVDSFGAAFAAHQPAVYASPRRSPDAAQDSLLPGDPRPWAVGTLTRGLLLEVSGRYLLSSSTRLAWRTRAASPMRLARVAKTADLALIRIGAGALRATQSRADQANAVQPRRVVARPDAWAPGRGAATRWSRPRRGGPACR
jgi:hypothetical protein